MDALQALIGHGRGGVQSVTGREKYLNLGFSYQPGCSRRFVLNPIHEKLLLQVAPDTFELAIFLDLSRSLMAFGASSSFSKG